MKIRNGKSVEGVYTRVSLTNEKGITLVALVITILLRYDEKKKCSNINKFLLLANC